MRGLKDKQTANTTMDRQRIYYNFIRPHQALNDQTPAQKARIEIGSEKNKWLQLIKQSLTV